ncbi:putative lipoprotein [[Clostridium] sordellii ATCC 9714]|nr:putative lipoprotein [[Clostridium] sordellii ATCC 9714] [Paeniclostridium sordellii ATCC 9714]
MKFSKLVSLGLIGLLTFGTVGCTTKTEEKKQLKKQKQKLLLKLEII